MEQKRDNVQKQAKMKYPDKPAQDNPQNQSNTSKLWNLAKNLFTVNDYVFDELFNLDRVKISKQDRSGKSGQTGEKAGQDKGAESSEGIKKGFRLPKKACSVQELKEKKQCSKPMTEDQLKQTPISEKLEENLDKLRILFRLPKNRDVVIREFSVPLNGITKAAIIYIDGAADTKLIDSFVLQPLMVLSNISRDQSGFSADAVKSLLVPTNQVAEAVDLGEIIKGVVNGDTAILLDGSDQALVVETKGWPGRSLGDPKAEKVTQGPSDAFNESFRQNLGLVRKRLRTNALVTEYFKVGWRSQTDLALLYLDGVTNKNMVREMRKRLQAIQVAYVTDTGMIQQLVNDSPNSIIPTSLATERPDRVTAFLNEGHIAIIMDGSPFAIVAPITIWGLLHSSEDYYLSPLVGTFMRFIRTLSFFIGVLTPAFYIAITNFHPEMIPTDLLLAIAATRELVPFPVIVEALLMEFSFELIREAGVRIPSLLGPTIGIVGALILGQAAVQANVVSPILVIVVAITALGSFTIPNVAFSFSVRVTRFIFILLAGILGFLGIAFGLMVLTYRVTSIKSLGISMLAPVAPFRPKSGDVVIRRPFFLFDSMPSYTSPQAGRLQAKLVRKWDPVSRNRIKGDW